MFFEIIIPFFCILSRLAVVIKALAFLAFREIRHAGNGIFQKFKKNRPARNRYERYSHK
jgi:hypothetical protein